MRIIAYNTSAKVIDNTKTGHHAHRRAAVLKHKYFESIIDRAFGFELRKTLVLSSI